MDALDLSRAEKIRDDGHVGHMDAGVTRLFVPPHDARPVKLIGRND
jgi:hypothetical protein